MINEGEHRKSAYFADCMSRDSTEDIDSYIIWNLYINVSLTAYYVKMMEYLGRSVPVYKLEFHILTRNHTFYLSGQNSEPIS